MLSAGVDTEHPDFEGRAGAGNSFVPDGSDEACQGMGTLMAGSAIGKTYGVAKKATVVDVRVARCDGTAEAGTVIKGIEWALDNPMGAKGNILLINWVGKKSEAVNQAVAKAHSRGFLVVVPAGEGGQDACLDSPGSSAEALTVGATTVEDQFRQSSGRGGCVDVLAPGEDIRSAWPGAEVGTGSGTALAAAHAAGVAATYMSAEYMTPDTALATITREATRNAVMNLPPNTPNLLVYNGGDSR
ncbi:S8 family serine peptidase [Streptomyces sp. RM72]|nr:S8 family serine peptidase [Streptomyces sp. RM72]